MESSKTGESTRYLCVNLTCKISYDSDLSPEETTISGKPVILVSKKSVPEYSLSHGQVFSCKHYSQGFVYIGVNIANNSIVFQNNNKVVIEADKLHGVKPLNFFVPDQIIRAPQSNERVKILLSLEEARKKYLDLLTELVFDLTDKETKYSRMSIYPSTDSFTPVSTEKDLEIQKEIKANLNNILI